MNRSKKQWLVYGLAIVLLLGSRSIIYLTAMEGEADSSIAQHKEESKEQAETAITVLANESGVFAAMSETSESDGSPAEVTSGETETDEMDSDGTQAVWDADIGDPEGQDADGLAASAAVDAVETAVIPELTEAIVGTKMAENERLELYVDEETFNVRIVDKKTKREWHGAPQLDKKTPPNNIKFVQAPVHIKYTQGTETSQTYSLQDNENTSSLSPIENGARAMFTFANHGITFAVEYRLTERGLAVSIPYESIQEQGPSRLVSVELLPFFHAAAAWQKGAIFVPDGSGALMVIKEQRSQNFNTYSEFIYGSDPVFLRKSHDMLDPQWRQATMPKQQIALPVYGIYADGTGFLGIVTEGDHDAKINAVPAGIRNISLYRASAEFLYRNDDIIFIGDSSEIPLYQGRMIGGDRSLEFVLLQDEDAHYVGMAEAYRQHLIDHYRFAKVVSEQIPLQIRIFSGILRDEVIGKTFIQMTTFDQIREIIDTYQANGIDHLEITIEGWSKGGMYGSQPKHFPVESSLGGYKALEELADYARQRDVLLYLKANYVRPFADTGDFRKNRDAVYGIKKEPIESYNYYLSARWNKRDETFFWLKPDRVYDRHIMKEVEQYVKLGIDGVHLQYVGDILYSDQDPDHLSSRNDTKKLWIRALDLFRQSVGRTAVDYGNAYVLGHVDRIDDLPLDSSHFTYLDETIPFVQIVLHGYVPYTAQPSNLADDPRLDLLRKLEYGAWPSYKLTYGPTQDLQRTMETSLFSSEFANWLEPSITEYEILSEVYQQTYDQPIVGHEKLNKWVYRTTYANGVQVIVNYHNKPQTVEGQTIEAYGYVVLEGGR